MSEEIKVSDEARECAENEADAYLCGRELGHHVQSLLTQRDEEIAELRKDKAKLDWMEKQPTLAMWQGEFSDSDYNIELGRAGAPICTLSTMDDDGTETDKEIASANNLRQAIDAAMSKDAK